jgi:ribosomal-protein-alanine N-acetyltransferase
MVKIEMKDVFGQLTTLETDRLVLRRLEADDLEDLFEYASDPELARYTSWPAHESTDDTREFLNHVLALYKNGEVAPWGVVYKADGKLVGTCGFLDWYLDSSRAEIGYALSNAYWGRGLMTEAVRRIIAFGFRKMELNRIQGRCEVENIGSSRVMEKAGMKLEGVLREHEYAKGRYLDMAMYSVLRREWTG